MKRNMITYYLPQNIITNEELTELYPEWSADKIFMKTGIRQRHYASDNEFSSDMAAASSELLFEEYVFNREKVDFIIVVTQSPDYLLPTTACLIQDILKIPKNVGALDLNLGCSGYVYGLAMAKSLVMSGIARNILLITADTYSKQIHPMDKNVRTIFGDAATSTLVDSGMTSRIGEFVFGTDGSGFNQFIIPSSGLKAKTVLESNKDAGRGGHTKSGDSIYMNGPEVFKFALKVVPAAVKEVLEKNKLALEDIDLFVFHQANKFMLDYLQRMLKIPDEKFYINIENIGNTVSSSIPVALKDAEREDRLHAGCKVLIVGFGVGLSWAATIIEW